MKETSPLYLFLSVSTALLLFTLKRDPCGPVVSAGNLAQNERDWFHRGKITVSLLLFLGPFSQTRENLQTLVGRKDTAFQTTTIILIEIMNTNTLYIYK